MAKSGRVIAKGVAPAAGKGGKKRKEIYAVDRHGDLRAYPMIRGAKKGHNVPCCGGKKRKTRRRKRK